MSSEKKEKKQHKMNFNIKEKLKKTFSKEPVSYTHLTLPDEH